MFGGSNNNSLDPEFGNEKLFQYPSNTSNQLQLFANAACNVDPLYYSARDHNKRPWDPDRPSSIPNPHHVSTGLRLSYDDEERNSSVTSASASMTLAPSIMSSFGDGITTELDRHKEEFERYIMIQEENMLKEMRNMKQRHTTSLLAAIEKGVDNKLREKEVEIETATHKNKQLVERIKQLAIETQNWHYQAKYNESLVNILKTNLEQALAQDAKNQCREGVGDTDEVASSMNAKSSKSCCKGCGMKEVCVMVMPCRHLSLCKECDGFTSVCPVCQVVKTLSVEVYLS